MRESRELGTESQQLVCLSDVTSVPVTRLHFFFLSTVKTFQYALLFISSFMTLPLLSLASSSSCSPVTLPRFLAITASSARSRRPQRVICWATAADVAPNNYNSGHLPLSKFVLGLVRHARRRLPRFTTCKPLRSTPSPKKNPLGSVATRKGLSGLTS